MSDLSIHCGEYCCSIVFYFFGLDRYRAQRACFGGIFVLTFLRLSTKKKNNIFLEVWLDAGPNAIRPGFLKGYTPLANRAVISVSCLITENRIFCKVCSGPRDPKRRRGEVSFWSPAAEFAAGVSVDSTILSPSFQRRILPAGQSQNPQSPDASTQLLSGS